MTTLFVARHGQTAWNLEHRWQGHADPPLNETGVAQAQRLAASLDGREIDRIYSSDLARARETAEIVGRLLGLEVRVDPRLREVDVGEWSGLTSAEIELRFPEGFRRRSEGGTGWRGGESLEAMAERVTAAATEIAAVGGAENVLVVTHGGCLRALWTASGGARSDWVDAGNGDLDEIAVEGGRIRWLDSTRGGLHQQVQR
jgi:broad specificity phosphatase PhoE